MSTEIKNEDAGEEVIVAVPEEGSSSDSDAVVAKKDALSHEPDVYPMRTFSFMIFGSELSINPFTSFFGFAFLWGLSLWCMVSPEQANATLWDWQTGVVEKVSGWR